MKAYQFEDIVESLNAVVEHDWRGFLERRVHATDGDGPADGIDRSGWKLVYRDKPGALFKAREADEGSTNTTSSIGLLVSDAGKVIDIIPGKAADKAGIGPGMKLIAVNDRRFTGERLRDAIAATAKGQKVRLLIENQEYFRTVTLNYADGDRYPHLERNTSKADLLADIFRPRAMKAK